MNVGEFKTLFDYNYWANAKLLKAAGELTDEQFVQEITSSFGSIRGTFMHILGAEIVWLSRFKGASPTAFPKSEDIPNLSALHDSWHDTKRDLTSFIAGLTGEDLGGLLNYKNMAGEPHTLPLGQALQHLANHSTYHRGQVTLLLRQLGQVGVATDMLFYYLERNASAAKA